MPGSYDIGDSIELSTIFTTLNTLGAIDAGSQSLVLQDAAGYANSDPIIVYGAGDAGGDLITTVTAVAGNTLTLAAAAKTSVIRGRVGKRVNPTTVICKVRLPDGTTSTPTASSSVTGIYKATFDPTQAGQHWYRFEGTGAAKGSGEQDFVVVEKRVV